MQNFLSALGIQLNYTRELLLFGLLLARTMPMVFLTPFLGGQLVPPEIKMGLGILLTILVWPMASDSLTAPLEISALPFLIMMLKEVFVGFAIGQVNSLIFYAMETAGRMIDTARGSSMSEVTDPHSHHRNTTTGELYFQLLLVFFVAIGGHHIFLDSFFYSFSVLPLNETLDYKLALKPFAEYAMTLTAQVMLIATVLSAPAVAATFITDVVFGIMNRVAPQLNAYFMAMPVKAMGGIAMVLVTLEAFLDRTGYFIQWGLYAVQKTIDLLGAAHG